VLHGISLVGCEFKPGQKLPEQSRRCSQFRCSVAELPGDLRAAQSAIALQFKAENMIRCRSNWSIGCTRFRAKLYCGVVANT
jgi:hypothetical protein